jgi:hypothetical protein
MHALILSAGSLIWSAAVSPLWIDRFQPKRRKTPHSKAGAGYGIAVLIDLLGSERRYANKSRNS